MTAPAEVLVTECEGGACDRCGGELPDDDDRRRFCSYACKRRAKDTRYRIAKRQRVTQQRIDRLLLVFRLHRREGGRCYLCCADVDLTIPATEKDGPTLDHVFPRSAGGTDHPSNLAVTHRRCNEAKGNAVIPDLRTLPVPTAVPPGLWKP